MSSQAFTLSNCVPKGRGFHLVYRDGEANFCPGCGRRHWIIGRQLAECGFCATALPLEQSVHILGGQKVRFTNRGPRSGEELT